MSQRFVVNGKIFLTQGEAEAYADKLNKQQILDAYRDEIKASNLVGPLKDALIAADLLA